MAEQVCPHCDREITQKDLDDYPIKLRKRALQEEYRKSKICRLRENMLFGLYFVGIILVVLSAFTHILFGFSANTSIYLEIIFTVVTIMIMVYGFVIKLPRLENEYINSRLQI